MSNNIYYRILGYVVTVALHVGNIVVMEKSAKPVENEDERVKDFNDLKYRYLTVWTFFLQIVYAFAALTCDLLTLNKSKTKDYKLPKYLRGFRDTLFCSVIWPSSLMVFMVFWSLYLYDRELIFPTYLDQCVSSASNHVMHTAILPIVLWELVFHPRTEPRSHKRYVGHTAFHTVLYTVVLIYTYIERGSWVYPILNQFYGTIYFALYIAISYVLALLFYRIQWDLSSVLCLVPEKADKKAR